MAELKLFKGGELGKWWSKQTPLTHAAIMLGVPAAGALALLRRKKGAATTTADPNAALPDLSGGYQPGPPISGYPPNINVTVQLPPTTTPTPSASTPAPATLLSIARARIAVKGPAPTSAPAPSVLASKPLQALAAARFMPTPATPTTTIARDVLIRRANTNLGAQTSGPLLTYTKRF